MARVRFCEICKQEIDSDRAEANPETRLCAVHVEAIKKYGGEFLTDIEDERTSKPGSMKINYGGIGKVTHTRNYKGIEQLRDDYLLER
jgi:hypothetical protein